MRDFGRSTYGLNTCESPDQKRKRKEQSFESKAHIYVEVHNESEGVNKL